MKRIRINWDDGFGEHLYNITFREGNTNTNKVINMLNTAEAYYLAGNRCIREEANGNGRITSLTLPSTVNYIFSIELYLKSFCRYRNGNFEKTHELLKLFKSLPDELKKEIVNEFESNFSSVKQKLLSVIKIIEEDSLTKSIDHSLLLLAIQSIIHLNLETLLIKANNFFVEIRYDFENEVMNYLDIPIVTLANILNKIGKRFLTEIN